MRCGTVNVADSGKLEKRRYDTISVDPEIQTKIGRHKNAVTAAVKRTHIYGLVHC
jgi:hypothetical protein